MFRTMTKKNLLNMTHGNIVRLIVSFSLPLLAGNLFQQLYNTVDSIVVGNYVGKEALAAVGASASLINMLVGFFSGLATGGGVVISHFFGASEIGDLRKTVHTMVLGTFILSIACTAFGVLSAPFMLRLMATPSDVFNEADTYLRIYFSGISFFMLYNMGAGILRAVGDSRHPLYFLVVSSFVNIALDLLFVIVFQRGIAGVAYATVISEALSAVLVFALLFRSNECYRVNPKELRISLAMLSRILQIGLPSALQMSITAFSNVFVQGYINFFGSSYMAGWASYTKIDQMVFLPVQTISLAVTTFVGQNYGARKMMRVRQGIRNALFLSCGIVGVLIALIMIFARPLVSLFNSEAEVLYYGTFLLRVCSPFYLMAALNNVYGGALRGLGNSTPPMLIMLSTFVVLRQIYLAVATRITDSFYPVSVAYPVGWTACSILLVLYYRRYVKKTFPVPERKK